MGDSGWEQTLTDGGVLDSCYAVALGKDDTQLFAAVTSDEGGDAWAPLYADDYETDVAQDDGSSVKQTINEWTTIVGAFEEGSFTPIYLGGQKYTFCNRDEQDDVTVVLAKRQKGGAVLVKATNGYITIGLFDEEREQSQGNAIDGMVAFGTYTNQF